MVRDGGGFFQRGVGGDHLAWDQILANAEMLQRALGLGAPELVGGHLDHTETVALLSHLGHVLFLRIDPDLPPAAGPTPPKDIDLPRELLFSDRPMVFDLHGKKRRGVA